MQGLGFPATSFQLGLVKEKHLQEIGRWQDSGTGTVIPPLFLYFCIVYSPRICGPQSSQSAFSHILGLAVKLHCWKLLGNSLSISGAPDPANTFRHVCRLNHFYITLMVGTNSTETQTRAYPYTSYLFSFSLKYV